MWQADHLEALSRFSRLESLELPRWAEIDEEWMDPGEVVLEAAAAIPRLRLLGLSGQQSAGQWYRIGRNKEGKADQVDAVTFYSTDLDQPC